ncbi:hypothetical protein PAPYR_13059 [Paratrimastix pyriformis]|uniref:Uncharacterized protein n=1 Tax=Paratrimastix pyriformis TaxID=342808 RepID=A0ABQ8U0X7_9EUKA|nr:hypothetical protein PAPYR_13059 [Paratrimastix pyriformis]
MKSNGDTYLVDTDDVSYIKLEPNYATSRASIEIKAGFNAKLITETTTGTSDVDMTNGIDAVHIHCNLCSGSYINNMLSDVVHTIIPNVVPGSQLASSIQNPIFLPLNVKEIRDIRIRVTDQNGNRLFLNGEPVSLTFQLRPT